MIGKKVFVWFGRNTGLQATVVATDRDQSLVDFGRNRWLGLRIVEDISVRDSYWVNNKHLDICT